MHRPLIIGGGATGALLTSLLPASTLSTTLLLEKSNNVGRMASSTGRGEATSCVTDSGAQYFTCLDGPSTEAIRALAGKGVLSQLPPHSIHGERPPYTTYASYGAPLGSGSVVSHYLTESVSRGLTYRKNTRVVSLEAAPQPSHLGGGGGGLLGWLCTTDKGEETWAPSVVLTIPGPQVLQLQGDTFQAVLTASGARAALSRVTFSSRFALAFHFPAATWEAFASRIPPTTSFGRYIGAGDPGGKYLRYLSFETHKRRLPTTTTTTPTPTPLGLPLTTPSFVAHSSIQYGEATPLATPEVQALLLDSALEALAAWAGYASPADLPAAPIEPRLHRWKYSQVTHGPRGGHQEGMEKKGEEGQEREEGDWVKEFVVASRGGGGVASGGVGGVGEAPPSPTTPSSYLIQGVPLSVGPSPPLILAGDWVTGHSNFAACLRSASGALAHLSSLSQ